MCYQKNVFRVFIFDTNVNFSPYLIPKAHIPDPLREIFSIKKAIIKLNTNR